MLSLYAFGKWAVAALAILGWCYWAIPAIVREAGNPALTHAARKQILLLAVIFAVPLLATLLAMVWLASSSDDEVPTSPVQTVQAQPQLRSSAEPPAVVADRGNATAVGDAPQRAAPVRSSHR